MTTGPQERDSANELVELIRVLEKTSKYLESIGLDDDTAIDFRRLLTFLRSRSAAEAKAILGRPASAKARVPKSTVPAEAVLALSLEELSAMIRDENSMRKDLEQIALVRFEMTRGSLSSLRTVEALRAKLLNAIANENAHGAIERLARGAPPTAGV